MMAVHAETEGEVREAIAAITAGKGVPAMLSPTGAHCLLTRAMCALDWLGTFLGGSSPMGPPEKDWTDAQLVEWLLTDLWARRSSHWLRLQWDAVARGVPFY